MFGPRSIGLFRLRDIGVDLTAAYAPVSDEFALWRNRDRCEHAFIVSKSVDLNARLKCCSKSAWQQP